MKSGVSRQRGSWSTVVSRTLRGIKKIVGTSLRSDSHLDFEWNESDHYSVEADEEHASDHWAAPPDRNVSGGFPSLPAEPAAELIESRRQLHSIDVDQNAAKEGDIQGLPTKPAEVHLLDDVTGLDSSRAQDQQPVSAVPSGVIHDADQSFCQLTISSDSDNGGEVLDDLEDASPQLSDHSDSFTIDDSLHRLLRKNHAYPVNAYTR